MSQADGKALQVVEQQAVLFYEDQIIAVRLGNGEVYVPIRPICDLLGVDRSAQQRRIQRDPVLAEVAQSVEVMSGAVMAPDIDTGSRPNTSHMLALPLDFLQGWLMGINADRVRPELRDRIIRYQKECYRVLAEAFRDGRLTTDPTFNELLASDSPTVQAYKMIMAMARMAQQQIIMEARLAGQERRLAAAETQVADVAQQVGGVAQRLEALETQLGDTRRQITPAQAMQVSQAVKAIALALGKRSGRNEFGGVYGELYRRFAITGYRELPAARFDEALNFLRQWYTSLEGGEVPF